MRIISSFRDYYDYVQKYGLSDVIYVREHSNVREPYIGEKLSRYYVYDKNAYYFTSISIGICGKFYPCVYIDSKSKAYCYSIEDIDKYVEKQDIDYTSKRWLKGFPRRQTFVEFFNSAKYNKENHEVFLKYKKPIVVSSRGDYNKTSLDLDCRLVDMDFAKIIHPELIYQSIESYLSCVIIPDSSNRSKYYGKPISLEVSDKDMAAAKGFDKNSFRKDKQ